MKKIVLSLIGLMSLLLSTSAQDISITNNDTTICSGTFWDSGIEGNYGVAENDTITICSNSGGAINFEFIIYNMFSNADKLIIFDGANVESNLIGVFSASNSLEGVTISSSESCITFVFISNPWGFVEGEGWAADISCSFPCQDFEVEVQTDFEALEEGMYTLCPEELLELDVNVSFPNNNVDYSQSTSNTSCEWNNNRDWEASGIGIEYYKGLSFSETLFLEVKDVNGCIHQKTFILESECQTIENQILVDENSPEYEEIYIPNGQSVNISFENNFPENNLCYDQSNAVNYLKIGTNDFIELTESIESTFLDGSSQVLILKTVDTLGCWAHDTLEIQMGCQPIEVEFGSDHPIVDETIKVCMNDTFSINVNTNYLYNDILYNQTDENTTFEWGIDLAVGQGSMDISAVIENPGSYLVQLNMTDVNGCVDKERVFVDVIKIPETLEIFFEEDILCMDDSLALEANYEISSPNIWSPTHIPDGTGVAYTYSKFVDDYTGIISSVTDLESICINIEHSYPGDLEIKLICPTGQSLEILNFPSGCTSVYLGEPCDVDNTTSVGNGYEYCFTQNEAISLPEFEAFENVYIDNDGNVVITPHFPAGNYGVVGDFSDLVGCPLGGEWILQIKDHYGNDDGYIFYWTLDFSEENLIENSGIWEENWSVESDYPADFVSMNDSTLFIPQDTGSYYIRYELTSLAGCGMDTVIGPISVLGNMELLEIAGDNEVVNGDIEVYNLLSESTGIIDWHVVGGTIVDEYSGDSIQVEWTSEAGYVMVASENMNGCNSIDVLYINSTDITENIKSEINLYPNPSQGLITIEMESDKSKSFTLINANGAVIMQDRLVDKETTIDLSHLPSGMYLVLVDGQYTQKLILE